MISLLVFLAMVAATGFTAGRFRPGAWFESLVKPSWNPPKWVFAPVWSVLYVAIAIAGWLAWRAAHERAAVVLALWGAQLLLNACWSWLFFGKHRPGAALADIVLLDAAVVAFVVAAYPVSSASAWLFAPYAAWVFFATALNAAVWRLNRTSSS